jgi:hypothetical protein
MKRIVIAFVLVALAMGIFASAASAQTETPTVGPLHDYMVKALAEKLNLTVAKVESEIEAGKTLAQIALDNGIAKADIRSFMLDVRKVALAAAVKDGVITQDQADRMLRFGGRGLLGGGNCSCQCTGLGFPRGRGMQPGRFQQQNNP